MRKRTNIEIRKSTVFFIVLIRLRFLGYRCKSGIPLSEFMQRFFKQVSEPKNFEEDLEGDIIRQFNISLCEDESSDSE